MGRGKERGEGKVRKGRNGEKDGMGRREGNNRGAQKEGEGEGRKEDGGEGRFEREEGREKRRSRASNGQRCPLPCCTHFGNLKCAQQDKGYC